MTTLLASRHDDIPPLAWVCEVPRQDDSVLHCGNGVVLDENAFFEGAWAGSYHDRGFGRCTNVFGSGGVVQGQSALFVTPSHTTEGLYVLAEAARHVVSNSLAFLLTYCGEVLPPSNWRYGELFYSIVSGLEASPTRIPLEGCELLVVYHHNFAIHGADLELAPKPLPPNFADYAAWPGRAARATRRPSSSPAECRVPTST
ncbi:MAG: hypothetical protein ACE5EV_00150 [Gaiellales bacterium]